MELSTQQGQIINAKNDLYVNGIAGSGKKLLIPEIVKRNKKEKILYLASDTKTARQAKAVFLQSGCDNVRVETVYSLAWKRIGHKRIKVKDQPYTPFELKNILGLDSPNPIRDLVIAWYAGELTNCFCNSNSNDLRESGFEKTLYASDELSFYWKNFDSIYQGAEKLLYLMGEWKIACTPDFYLKYYQATNPHLQSDLIIVDRAQDVPMGLSLILNKQPARKVIIGDEHQQIFRKDYRVSLLDETDISTTLLNRSYRYNELIANQVRSVLARKKYLYENFQAPVVQGMNNSCKIESRAIIGRTKSAVLKDAIQRSIFGNDIDSFAFEGGLNYFTSINGQSHIKDVVSLYAKEPMSINDSFIKSIGSFENLQSYAAATKDQEFGEVIKLVKEYGKELPSILRKLRKKKIDNHQQIQADLIYSTAEQSSGKAYDEVTILDDFTIIDKDLCAAQEIDYIGTEMEINQLYLACSRAQVKLNLCASVEATEPDHHLIYEEVELPKINKIDLSSVTNKRDRIEEIYTLNRTKTVHHKIYERWTSESDRRLVELRTQNESIESLAQTFKRTKSAINMRLKKLGNEGNQ